jgi:hypothetical protein
LSKDNAEKFRRDVEESEAIIGSEADIWEELESHERESKDLKKTIQAAFKAPVEPPVVIEEKVHHVTYYVDPSNRYVDPETERTKILEEVKTKDEYKCPWCQFLTTRVNNIVAHVKIHSPNGVRWVPRMATDAWVKMREKLQAKDKRRKMKKLAAIAKKVPVVIGPDGKPSKEKKFTPTEGDGSPARKRKKKEEKKIGASELVADWDEVIDDDEPATASQSPSRSPRVKRESLVDRQKEAENAFDALFKDAGAAASEKPKPTFSRFSLPSAHDDEEANENGVPGSSSMSDEDFDDAEIPTSSDPFDFGESDEEPAAEDERDRVRVRGSVSPKDNVVCGSQVEEVVQEVFEEPSNSTEEPSSTVQEFGETLVYAPLECMEVDETDVGCSLTEERFQAEGATTDAVRLLLHHIVRISVRLQALRLCIDVEISD